MAYFILNQGSFVRGTCKPYSHTEVVVYVDKILWYDEGDDEAKLLFEILDKN